MILLKTLVSQITLLVTRFPWTVAIFGFVSGLASFFLVERKQEFAQIIALLMLVSWVWLALEKLLSHGVSRWFGVKLPQPLVSFATQMVHQESLFFVIPFFFITTAWNSGQMVFTVFLITAAVVSIIDPLYYKWLAPRRWLYFIYHGLTLFAVLLTALPIIFHLPTAESYLWSLAIAIALTLLTVGRDITFTGLKRAIIIFALALASVCIGLGIRPWIPPATLWLTQVAVTDHIDDANRSPNNALKIVSVAQLQAGLYAYTAIHAPRGLNERIYHEWRLKGQVVDKVALDINGGREAGYRAWSHKVNFPENPVGRWEIHIITDARQVIGILRFEVVASLPDVQAPAGDPAPGETAPPEAITPDSVMKAPITDLTHR